MTPAFRVHIYQSAGGFTWTIQATCGEFYCGSLHSPKMTEHTSPEKAVSEAWEWAKLCGITITT